MRTTLDIDDDVLQAAKEIAASRRLTAGQVMSELARKGLEPAPEQAQARLRNGVPLLPRRPTGRPSTGSGRPERVEGRPRPTMRRVNELRDQP